jgi:DNA-binding MarR family transcriptional regulator
MLFADRLHTGDRHPAPRPQHHQRHRNRRRHTVEITAAGRKALARAEQALDGLEDDVLAGLTTEERVTLRGLLVRALADVPAAV